MELRTSPSRLDFKQLRADYLGESYDCTQSSKNPSRGLLAEPQWAWQGGTGHSLPLPLNLKYYVGFQNTVERLDSTRLRKASVCRHTQWLRHFYDAGETLSWPGSNRLFLS